jgi:heme/copper-type cytochrome/quinol oxidase subunit 2
MPVVVEVRTPDDFKKWVEEEKAAAKQAAAPAPSAAPVPAGAADAAPPKSAQLHNVSIRQLPN